MAGYQIYAVELSDDERPRRRADRPNLYVGITTLDPVEKLARTRAGGRGSPMVRQHGLRVRADLTSSYPIVGSRGEAERQKTRLVRRLSRRGHAVNGDRRVWRLYVVELADAVGSRVDASKPWVYVGETSKDPGERLEEHLTGARNGRGRLFASVVRDHGFRLLPELVGDAPAYYTSADAKQAEADLANRLRSIGYSVRGGH